MRLACLAGVVAVALLQLAWLGFWTANAVFTDDSLGISRALAVLAMPPIVLLTLPSLFLLTKRQPYLAFALSTLSVLATIVLWRSA